MMAIIGGMVMATIVNVVNGNNSDDGGSAIVMMKVGRGNKSWLWC